jgi:hypothetical protein
MLMFEFCLISKGGPPPRGGASLEVNLTSSLLGRCYVGVSPTASSFIFFARRGTKEGVQGDGRLSLSKREGLFIVSPLSFFSLVLLFSVEPYWGFDPPPNPLILSPFYSNVGALGYPVGCHCSSLRNSLAHIPVCTPFEGERKRCILFLPFLRWQTKTRECSQCDRQPSYYTGGP